MAGCVLRLFVQGNPGQSSQRIQLGDGCGFLALQEEALAEGSVSFSLVRSAQWMEFALNPAAVEERDNEVDVSDWHIQPIAVDAVAGTLVEVATGAPRNRMVAGPEAIRLPELTRLVPAARGDGSLLAPADAELLGPTPQEWVR